jgi:hypothetical protein
MGAFVNYGLPIVAGIATGGLSFLPAVAASAAASGAAKLMTGYTPEDAAKAAAIAAATRGVLKGTGLEDSLGTLLSAKGSAAGNVVGNAVNPGFYVPGTVIPKFVAPTLSGLGGTFGSLAAAPVAGEILVQGTRNVVNPALASAITGGLSTLTPAVFDPGSIPQFQSPDVSNAETQLGEEPESVVTGDRIRITPPGTTLPPFTFDPSVIPQVNVPRVEPPVDEAESDEPESVVTGDRIRITPPGTTLPIIPFDPSVIPQTNVPRVEPPPTDAESDDDEQVVTGTRTPPNPPTTITFPNAPFYVPPTTIPPFEAPPPVEKPPNLPKTIGQGVGVLTLLDQLLGGGGGGGGGGGINSAAGTRASLSPIFSAKLPEARGIFSPASFAPRDMSGTDFARYGYGPAKSFFENVPRNVEEYKAALAANSAPRPAPTGTGQPGLTVSSTGQSTPGVANPQFAGATTVAAAIRRLAPDATDEQIDAYLSGPEGARFLEIMNESGITQRRARGGMMAAKGGASKGRDAYAVRGPGTGRSDEIPALLSDGEYVIDAETVSMLGDGSGEAGAKRLDEFRIKIRKHKGRNLARGKFSDNAKRPDKYLSGGRV